MFGFFKSKTTREKEMQVGRLGEGLLVVVRLYGFSSLFYPDLADEVVQIN
jgi:hypothetical protein